MIDESFYGEKMFFLNSSGLMYFWLIVSVLFLFAEISTPGLFFFVAFAMGSSVASVFAFFNFSFMNQCIIALVSSLFFFLLLRHYFSSKTKSEDAETNVDALKGKKGVVIKEIYPNDFGSGSFGRVKVGGEEWPAQDIDNLMLQKGTVVRIVQVQGNRLIVKKV